MILFHLLCALPFLTLARCGIDPVFDTKTFNVGETVTLQCPRRFETNLNLYWIRLSGNVPESLGGTPSYDIGKSDGSSHSSVKTQQEHGSFVLSLDAAELSDTGFYFCLKVQHLSRRMTFVSVTFLNIKVPDSDVSVVSPELSGPVNSGDSVDLQCWVQTENAQCFEEHMVWWFRPGLDQSGPGLVYTQRNSSGQCDRSTEGPGPHKCLYTFSKTMSVSDAGTYHCAVAACGHIVFGNGTKVHVKENKCDLKTIIISLSALLSISLIVIMVLICCFIKRKCFQVGKNADDINIRERTSRQQREVELMYSAPLFNKKKVKKSQGRRVKTEDFVVYSDVRK